MPDGLRAALRQLFDDQVDDVEIVENSWYARLHHGARATTRRNRILLPGPATEFFADPALVLHEYFHVLKQWNRGRLTVPRYLAEWLRRGYWMNRYERQARRFVDLRLPAMRRHLDNLARGRLPAGPEEPARGQASGAYQGDRHA
jgi:hypothetical protein